MDKEKFANIIITEFYDNDYQKHKSYKLYKNYQKFHNKFYKGLNEKQKKEFLDCEDLLWTYFVQRENEILLYGIEFFKNVILNN